jgi:hypothetical protein
MKRNLLHPKQSFLGRDNAMNKGSEIELSLFCSKSRIQTQAAITDLVSGKQSIRQSRDEPGQALVRSSHLFYSRYMGKLLEKLVAKVITLI